MKPILLSMLAIAIGSGLLISCAQKQASTTTSSSAYNSSGKDAAPRVRDTGPRQSQ